METKKLTFKELTENFIYLKLGYEQVYEHNTLKDWMDYSKNLNISSEDMPIIKRLQNRLIERSSIWNEFELSECFIGPLIMLIDFNTTKFKFFACRNLTAKVKEYELIGKPDAMIAFGIDEPITPYFCFSEYKQQTDPNGNPRTQLLGAMIAAQELNNNEKPIYGMYVIGYTWTFVVLKDNKWCESNSYSAKDNDIFDIYKMLLALKEIIFNQ